MSYEEELMEHKTARIAILSILLFILGLFFFLYKIEACKSTPTQCKDEFVEIKKNDGYASNHTCSPGATVEVVASPTKPGIICHCPSNVKIVEPHQP
jgi:hypothetical protein